MLDVLGKDRFLVTAAEDEHSVMALAPDGVDCALAQTVMAPGCSEGVVMTLVPSAAKMALKKAVNLASPSPMRNLIAFAWSASFIERFRACWLAQVANGYDAMQVIRTRRRSRWMNTSTESLRRTSMSMCWLQGTGGVLGTDGYFQLPFQMSQNGLCNRRLA